MFGEYPSRLVIRKKPPTKQLSLLASPGTFPAILLGRDPCIVGHEVGYWRTQGAVGLHCQCRGLRIRYLHIYLHAAFVFSMFVSLQEEVLFTIKLQ